MDKSVTIGIPRGLSYYDHGELWENFFKSLGFATLTSNLTNSHILNDGVVCCTNETCLPVKVFHGHIKSLMDKVDFIFVPRYSSTSESELCCPKLCGLPDMTSYNIQNDVKIIEIKVNIRHLKSDTYESLREISKILGLRYHTVLSAFKSNVETHLEFTKAREANFSSNSNQKSIVVLGHSYMIYDDYLSMGLISKLKKNNCFVYTPANLNSFVKKINAHPYQDKYFFNSGIEILGAAFTYANYKDLSGVVYLTPFACGVDSLVVEFIERHLNTISVPFLKLTIDEHTGEAGFDTRLEAFLDMIG